MWCYGDLGEPKGKKLIFCSLTYPTPHLNAHLPHPAPIPQRPGKGKKGPCAQGLSQRRPTSDATRPGPMGQDPGPRVQAWILTKQVPIYWG